MVTRFCFVLLLLWPMVSQAQTGEDMSDEEGQPVDIPLPHVATGVLPQRVFIDPQGRYVAIFGQEKPTEQRSRRIDLYRGIPSTLVVIDLNDLSILRREKISGDIRDAFLDGQQLFWVPKNVNLLRRLELNSNDPVEQHPYSTPILQILPVGDEALAILFEENGKSRAKVFRRDNLKPIINHPLAAFEIGEVRGRGDESPKLAYSIGDGLISLRGLWLINQNDGTTRCLVSRFYGTTHLVRMASSGPSGTLRTDGKYAWKRTVFPGGVNRFQGARLYGWQVRENQWDLSQVYPFVAVLDVSGRSEETRLMVQLKDLVTGRVVRENGWQPDKSLRDVRNHYSTYFVRTGGRRVVTTFGDNVYLDEFPNTMLDTVKIPLRLLYPQAALASTSDPIGFTLKADGGTPPYSFQSTKPLEGVKLNSKTGLVEIDLPGIWKEFVNEITAGRRRDVATTRQMAQAGLSSFKSATGIEIKDSEYGVGLPLWFKVTDSAGQDDQVFINIPVIGPKSEIESALSTSDQTQLQARRERAESYAKKNARQRAHNRMARFGLGEFWFFATQALVYGIYLAVAIWYVWPWMTNQSIHRALTPICLVTAIRVIGTSLVLPGMIEDETLMQWLTPMAIADTMATILGLVGAVVLSRGSQLAVPFTWVVALWGLGDTLLCYFAYMKITFEPAIIGSAYLVPVFAPTPAPIAYLLLLVYLVRRPDRCLNA